MSIREGIAPPLHPYDGVYDSILDSAVSLEGLVASINRTLTLNAGLVADPNLQPELKQEILAMDVRMQDLKNSLSCSLAAIHELAANLPSLE